MRNIDEPSDHVIIKFTIPRLDDKKAIAEKIKECFEEGDLSLFSGITLYERGVYDENNETFFDLRELELMRNIRKEMYKNESLCDLKISYNKM